MNAQLLHRRVAALAGTLRERLAWGMAVERLDADHAAALVDMAGLGVIPALIEAGATPAILQGAVEAAVLWRHWDLKEIERATFAAWCRLAAFTAPETQPETFDLYRGTLGCTPAEAAAGLHWTPCFDTAAWYAARFADAALTGAIVLHTQVARKGIAVSVAGSADEEMVLVERPSLFEVITDPERIGEAAVRWDCHMVTLRAEGWASVGDHAKSRQVAMEARVRIAAQSSN